MTHTETTDAPLDLESYEPQPVKFWVYVYPDGGVLLVRSTSWKPGWWIPASADPNGALPTQDSEWPWQASKWSGHLEQRELSQIPIGYRTVGIVIVDGAGKPLEYLEKP